MGIPAGRKVKNGTIKRGQGVPDPVEPAVTFRHKKVKFGQKRAKKENNINNDMMKL